MGYKGFCCRGYKYNSFKDVCELGCDKVHIEYPLYIGTGIAVSLMVVIVFVVWFLLKTRTKSTSMTIQRELPSIPMTSTPKEEKNDDFQKSKLHTNISKKMTNVYETSPKTRRPIPPVPSFTTTKMFPNIPIKPTPPAPAPKISTSTIIPNPMISIPVAPPPIPTESDDEYDCPQQPEYVENELIAEDIYEEI